MTTRSESGGDHALTRDPIWLVVGLGNPGLAYARHRHNVGYLVLDELAARAGSTLRAHKSRRADVLEARASDWAGPQLDNPRVILGRSRGFMNESGSAVATLTNFYKVEPDHLVVIHDELDLPFPSLRIKFGGGDNGHNGLRSIRSALGTGEFTRVRAGIGRPTHQQPVADYVLSPYSASERAELAVQVDQAAEAVVSLITKGLTNTQNAFN